MGIILICPFFCMFEIFYNKMHRLIHNTHAHTHTDTHPFMFFLYTTILQLPCFFLLFPSWPPPFLQSLLHSPGTMICLLKCKTLCIVVFCIVVSVTFNASSLPEGKRPKFLALNYRALCVWNLLTSPKSRQVSNTYLSIQCAIPPLM